MRKNFGAKPWSYPQPVFIIAAYDEAGNPDAMNAAWGGISDTAEVSICLSASHKTVKNILARKAFTISMATASQVVACDYVGLVSGNQVPDKFQRAGFHADKARQVDAPLSLETILDESGKIDPDKLEPIVFDPVQQTYRKLGDTVGHAFRDGKKLK